MGEWLGARGHQGRAVTAPPFNPEWRVAPGFSPWRYSREDSIGNSRSGALFRELAVRGPLTVPRCPLWVPLRPAASKRILHLASFALASFLGTLVQIPWHPHLTLVVEPAVFCLPSSLVI